MFKNPLKYQNGGTAASQEELVQLFQAAAENAQVDPEQLVQKASEIGQDEEAAAQFMQGLQLCAQGDPEGIKFIKSLFQNQAFRKGGKIFEFVCKYKKGGYVSGCGCKEDGGIVEKHQQKDGRGSGKLSTPVSTTPKDSSQVEYNMVVPGTEYVLFTDNNGNDIAWGRDKRHNLYNWHAGSEKMYFDPNQQEEYIPYSRFKQWNTGISGSSRLSEEDAQNLNNLFEYAKNNYYNGLKEKGNNIINGLSGLYNRFIGKRVPDTIEATGRRLKTWTDKNGIQHFVEDANVNGNSTVTTIDINGADITGKQKITTGDGRYRMVNLQPGTPEWIAAMSRNVQQQEKGGKVEKHQQDDKSTGTIGNSRQENLRSAADVRQAMNENPEYNRWSYSVSSSDGTKVQTLGNALTQGSLITSGRDSVITGYPAMRTLGVPEINNTEPGWPQVITKWNEILRSNKTTPYYEFDQNALDRERVKLRTPKQEKCGGKVVKAQRGKKVNNNRKTITEVGRGLDEYDAKEMGIDPNTLAGTSSIITAYPNKKPYVVNGQIPFGTRNGLVFNLGGVESDYIEDGVRMGKGVPGRKYKVSSVLDQDGLLNFDYNENAKEFPMISRYASPKDTIYYLNFNDFDKNTLGYEEVRSMYNKAIDQPDTFALNKEAYLELQRQKQERASKKENGGKVEKAQDGIKSLYQQITADGPETYTDGYGTVRQMYESPIITGLRKAYHWINKDRSLSDEDYFQKHGYAKPIVGMPPGVTPIGKINPTALERATAKAAGWGAVSDAIAEILPGWAMAGAAAIAKDEIDKNK